MRLTKLQLGLVLSGGSFFGLVMLIAAKATSIKVAAALSIAMVGCGVVVLYPFVGLALIALFTQLDALANLMFGELPVSFVKTVTFFTMAGVGLNMYRLSRSERFGQDELMLRLTALFAIILVMSAFFAEFPEASLDSLRRHFSLLILLYLTIYLIRSPKQVELVLLCIIASTAFSAAIILWDWTQGGKLMATSSAATKASWNGIERSTGASDYDATATAAMTLTGTTLALFYSVRTQRWRLLTVPAAALGSAAVIVSLARSAALCYAIAVIWLILKFYRDRRLPLVIATAAILAAGAVPLVPTAFWDRLGTLQEMEADSSMMRRWSYQLVGLDMVLHNPVLGVGTGNFNIRYADPEYRFIPGRAWAARRNSNMYLQVAASVGLIGAAVFGLMLLVAFVGLVRVRREGATEEVRTLAEATQFCFVIYLIICLFAAGTYNKYTWILLGLAVVVTRLGLRADEASQSHDTGRG